MGNDEQTEERFVADTGTSNPASFVNNFDSNKANLQVVQQESSGKNYNEVDVDYYDESFQNDTILPDNPYQ